MATMDITYDGINDKDILIFVKSMGNRDPSGSRYVSSNLRAIRISSRDWHVAIADYSVS